MHQAIIAAMKRRRLRPRGMDRDEVEFAKRVGLWTFGMVAVFALALGAASQTQWRWLVIALWVVAIPIELLLIRRRRPR